MPQYCPLMATCLVLALGCGVPPVGGAPQADSQGDLNPSVVDVINTDDGNVDEGIDDGCQELVGLEGQRLRQAIYERLLVHEPLSYKETREYLFSTLNNVDGRVQCVYTGVWVPTKGVPDGQIMNTEHTWCQSWGSGTLPAKTDLHHLFPTLTGVNSVRSNHPFGDVVDPTWSSGGSALGASADGRRVFEPRDVHKGDCARAMFYFAIRYQRELDHAQEVVLRQWHDEDPPGEAEILRNNGIEEVQANRNLLVDCPHVIERIPDL